MAAPMPSPLTWLQSIRPHHYREGLEANADALTPYFSNQQGRGEVQSLRELGASLERVLCVVCCVFCVWCVSAMTRRDSFDEQQDSLFFLDRCQI